MRSAGLILMVFAVGLLLPQSILSGEIYRYVDEQGKLHITDTPPPEGRHRNIKVYRHRAAPVSKAPPEKNDDKAAYVLPFSREGFHGMLVEATLTNGINSITRRFVVDTGASATVITIEDVKQLGISEEDVTGSSLGMVPGGGRVLAIHVPLDSMTLGDLEISNPVVAVIKGGSMRLLGIDVLGRFDLEVKNEQGIIILKQK